MPRFDDDSADLGWLAFQYVTDELPAGEVEAFEERLSCDQQAREAVAEAVLLSQALTVGSSTRVRPARQRVWSMPLAWAALGAAVCLVALLGGQWFNDPQSPTAQQTNPPAAAEEEAFERTEEELALAWASTFLAAGSNDESKIDNLLTADDEVGLAAEVEQGVSVPGWMVEALHGFDQAQEAAGERKES